jgi:hypothetical protein
MHYETECFCLVIYRYPSDTNQFQAPRFQQNTSQAAQFSAPSNNYVPSGNADSSVEKN